MENTSRNSVIREALLAVADGPFFSDAEFAVRFCFQRGDFRTIARSFNHQTAVAGDVRFAVYAELFNLTGELSDQSEDWKEWLSVSSQDLKTLWEDLSNDHKP